LTQAPHVDDRDFEDVKISAAQASFLSHAPQDLQAFAFWLISKLTLSADQKAAIHGAIKPALANAVASSHANLQASANAAQKKLE
jgi:hypothetical protein